MPEWDPELVVDDELAEHLVRSQFPELAGEPISFLAAGWDNAVYAVGDRWIFRLPRRSIALPGVGREIELLGTLASHVPVPVPVPVFVGHPTERYPWPFFGAERLSGAELAAAGLEERRRGPLAADLGSFLAALHAPDNLAWVDGRLPHDPMGRADMAIRVPRTREWLDAAAGLGMIDAHQRLRAGAILAEAVSLAPPAEARLVHGDLHLRHALVDADGRLSGVIDWGDMCLADPAIDLSLAYSHLPTAARRQFFRAYGSVDSPTEQRARVLGLMLSAALAVSARDQRIPWLETAAAADLRRLCAEA
jgi:aminoglycoside phosphotransferase (APT) family kinase protein